MMQPRISDRAKAMPPSPIRKLVPYAEEAKSRGTHVYHLNIGQPDIETPKPFWEAIRKFPAEVLEYGHSAGMLEYRKGLVGYYAKVGITVDPSEIIVTTGGSEAIVFAFSALCDAGEEMLCFEPFYTNYNGYAIQSEIKLVPVTCQAEDGYHLPSAEEIISAITPRTRGMLICSPNNPTGTVLSREELERLAAIAEAHNLWVVSDEAYREFVYDGEHTSVMHIPSLQHRAVLLDSISKRYSACGARIGCIISHVPKLNNALLCFAQARLCPPTLEQVGAQAMVNLEGDYFSATKAEYQARRDVVIEELGKIPGVLCKKPSGAFYVMAKLPIDDADNFARWMLTDFSYEGGTTMVAPGSGFYATPDLGTDEIRIAYVLKLADLRKAMRCLAEGLKTYPGRKINVE